MKNKKIAVIGAGMAGITIARKLDQNNEVIIFDKARGIGGRMATRRIGDYHFDHGAQYFTAKNSDFKELCKDALQNNVIAKWPAKIAYINYNSELDSTELYVAKPQMNSLCKYLAQDLQLKLEHKITKISYDGKKWTLIFTDNNKEQDFDLLIIAIPPAQLAELVTREFKYYTDLQKYKMTPCYSLMLGLKSKILYEFDAAKIKDQLIAWFAFNNHKPGRTGQTALLINTTNEWAAKNLELADDAVINNIVKNLNKFIKITDENIEVTNLQRWRYANIIPVLGQKSFFDAKLNLAICGDWLISARVESAFLSATDLYKKIIE